VDESSRVSNGLQLNEAGLTQKQVAAKMKTSQAAVARLESGRGKPSTSSLERYASVVGKRVKISLEPP